MAEPPNEKDRGGDEDLFEDLDQFFAPLDEGDWPEEDEARPAAKGEGAEASRPAPDDAGRAEDVETDLQDLEIEIPDEQELLGAEPPQAQERGGEPEAAAEDLREAPTAEETPEVAAAGTVGEPPAGAEATPEEAALSDTEPGAPAAEDDWAEAEAPAVPAAEGETPLSVDDLRTAPPEYSDLPSPPEDQPVLAEEASVGSLQELEGLGEVQAGPTDEEDEFGLPTEEAEGPGQEPTEEEEEAVAEAAADHFAEGLRPEEVERELLADLDEPDVHTVQIDSEAAAGEAAQEEPPAGAEGAPTWEEEGAQPVLEEEEARPEGAPAAAALVAGRNLTAAIISGGLLAAAVIALLVIGKGAFAVFATLIVMAGQAEFYAVMRTRGYRPATLLGLVIGAFMVGGAYVRGEGAVLFGLPMAVGFTALWYMAASPESRKGLTADAGVTLVGVLFVPGLASFALLLLALPGDIGRNVFLTVVGLTVLYDVVAYLVGSVWGNRPLAPTISPGKSWEGLIGATLSLLLVALAIVPSIDPFTASTSVILALLIAVAAPLGDLVESAFKRDLGVKDMGTILPGHGGILDRIDAILLAAPVAYYFLRIAFL
jgi:phosphatidate cytidylyltransferase